jgi:drug/metabolite transporter (DMT)-like permease
VIYLLALAGVVSISFSAIFFRLAAVSPATAAFYRAAYALPLLLVIWLAVRATDSRSRRERLLAALSGVLLAADLVLWHQSIELVGAGLGTVLANVQVVFVAVVGWLLYDERLPARRVALILVVLGGVALTSGLGRHDAYGLDPAAGVAFGLVAALCYSGYLLMFRASNRSLAPAAGPLLDATIGTAVGALLLAPLDPAFALRPTWPGHFWLAVLAIVSQVIGWLCIATALPRLPAIETSILLLGQPVCAVIWGMMLFDERLSALQWLGSAIVLAGVATLSMTRGGATR